MSHTLVYHDNTREERASSPTNPMIDPTSGCDTQLAGRGHWLIERRRGAEKRVWSAYPLALFVTPFWLRLERFVVRVYH